MSVKEQQSTEAVTVDAGIAIAGVWLSAAAITITIQLISFVFNEPAPVQDATLLGILIVFLMIAWPVIAACWATKLILNKED